MKRRREMQEVDAPEMFQFTARQSQLSGVLIDIANVTVKGKETTQYMFQDEDGLKPKPRQQELFPPLPDSEKNNRARKPTRFLRRQKGFGFFT